MSKVIVYHPDEWTNLNAPFLVKIWKHFFSIESYDKNKKYSPNVHIFWASCLNTNNGWYVEHHKRGHKIIIDYLWESDLSQVSLIENNILTLRYKNWFWYNESLWYRSLDYQNYKPNKTYQNTFLMLMNVSKLHRDQIFNKIDLNNALYSYVEKNIFIANDIDHAGSWQRYFCPQWYDNTSFSVVVETGISTPTFVSEKIFKPMAYYHPFLVWGSPFTLDYLHSVGFETFSHVIDESYDTVTNNNLRLKIICEQTNLLIQDYKNIFNDNKTQEILKHNHNLFFDSVMIEKFQEEIIGKVLEFINQ